MLQASQKVQRYSGDIADAKLVRMHSHNFVADAKKKSQRLSLALQKCRRPMWRTQDRLHQHRSASRQRRIGCADGLLHGSVCRVVALAVTDGRVVHLLPWRAMHMAGTGDVRLHERMDARRIAEACIHVCTVNANLGSALFQTGALTVTNLP